VLAFPALETTTRLGGRMTAPELFDSVLHHLETVCLNVRRYRSQSTGRDGNNAQRR
jgi:hypothetical protein